MIIINKTNKKLPMEKLQNLQYYFQRINTVVLIVIIFFFFFQSNSLICSQLHICNRNKKYYTTIRLHVQTADLTMVFKLEYVELKTSNRKKIASVVKTNDRSLARLYIYENNSSTTFCKNINVSYECILNENHSSSTYVCL